MSWDWIAEFVWKNKDTIQRHRWLVGITTFIGAVIGWLVAASFFEERMKTQALVLESCRESLGQYPAESRFEKMSNAELRDTCNRVATGILDLLASERRKQIGRFNQYSMDARKAESDEERQRIFSAQIEETQRRYEEVARIYRDRLHPDALLCSEEMSKRMPQHATPMELAADYRHTSNQLAMVEVAKDLQRLTALLGGSAAGR